MDPAAMRTETTAAGTEAENIKKHMAQRKISVSRSFKRRGSNLLGLGAVHPISEGTAPVPLSTGEEAGTPGDFNGADASERVEIGTASP